MWFAIPSPQWTLIYSLPVSWRTLFPAYPPEMKRLNLTVHSLAKPRMPAGFRTGRRARPP